MLFKRRRSKLIFEFFSPFRPLITGYYRITVNVWAREEFVFPGQLFLLSPTPNPLTPFPYPVVSKCFVHSGKSIFRAVEILFFFFFLTWCQMFGRVKKKKKTYKTLTKGKYNKLKGIFFFMKKIVHYH